MTDIKHLVQDLVGSSYFFTMDLRQGFHQMPVRPLTYLPYPYVAWILNTTTHSTTGFTPMELLYGTAAASRQVIRPKDASDYADNNPLHSVAEYLTTTDTLLSKLVRSAQLHEKAKRHREGRAEAPTKTKLKPGDFVLRKNIQETKLHGHAGPFKVVTVHDYNAVVTPLLADKGQSTPTRRTVHLSHRIPLKTDLKESELAYLASSDQEEWFVDKIVGHTRDGLLKVRWVGSDAITTEPVEALAHTPAAKSYLTKHPRLLREGSVE
ncbi:hypothetical protein J8273_0835 [Carpediemonas membranifera]|uniref:Uncharacterized protein n=1 Tax=Carpediemonas membranifera TaxID=201153 RepID=A0A8J6AXM0_9EUKA|nr:hypothetical protein J8273_0835 [Carpediemonas membranifera]|eukprot:KAG9397351.1 hypothetical protein J8273_0835 [Carpediemonas membranifera]